jgi:hypothetical protein
VYSKLAQDQLNREINRVVNQNTLGMARLLDCWLMLVVDMAWVQVGAQQQGQEKK